MKVNPKRRKWLIGGAAAVADRDAELRALRDRRYRLRPHQLRQPGLPAHDARVAVQHAQEQHRAFLHQAAVANHADRSEERQRRQYVRRDERDDDRAQHQLAAASSTAWKTATTPMSSNVTTYSPGQSLGSPQMSQLAMIEMSDSISPDCITAVGAVPGSTDAERHREHAL